MRPLSLRSISPLLFALVFVIFVAQTFAAQCDKITPCKSGCCSKFGSCGFGPDFCGDGCQGTCNATAECGQYAPKEKEFCPLNVCCSQWGFCGTTSEFCNDKCQNGCLPVVRPSCPSNTNAMDLKRRIGYFELWAKDRPCDQFSAERIAGGALTHINIAFALIDSSFRITDTDGDQVAAISRLKRRYNGLRVNIAIGGWTFNDPPTQARFSDMASTIQNQDIFIDSLVSFIQKYGLNGVDLDWEYPEADDRGGLPRDYANYVTLLGRIRDRFDQVDPSWELSITLPSSYWYLQHFDVNTIQKFVSYFNFMSYDIHGSWDQLNQWTGPYLKGHTNWTEIDQGLDLLWHNGVTPDKVVMGFGFYGRSFTMTDPACGDPGCTFSGAGAAGDCSKTMGILTYAEVASKNLTLNSVSFHYDPVTTVKYMIYAGNQWISFDDAQSFHDKKALLSSRCLGGLMIWAIDQDTQDYQALTGLLGDKAMQGALLHGGDLTDAELADLANDFAAYTGQNCYVTPHCTDGSLKQRGVDQVCAAGYTPVETAHAPYQAAGSKRGNDKCQQNWFHQICCPTKAMPKNCKWTGAPQRATDYCSGQCAKEQFSLNMDPFVNAAGSRDCGFGHRSLCCDSTPALGECRWESCQPQNKGISCSPGYVQMISATGSLIQRYDTDDGSKCPRDPTFGLQVQPFCCPKVNTYKKCHWGNAVAPINGFNVYDAGAICTRAPCNASQVAITRAYDPYFPELLTTTTSGFIADCEADYPPTDGTDPEFSLCCDPPTNYNNQWPVDPKFLWSNPYYDDVQWQYADNYGENNADPGPSDPTDHPGDDPYGFVMLDGPEGAISGSFGTDFTVVRRDSVIPKVKRSVLTTNRTILDATFEHKEEVIHVYCNHRGDDHPKCQSIFLDGGAKDTIIRLPAHVGDGPFARVVSMDIAFDFDLPKHHILSRRQEQNENVVYRVVYDYNFHLIKRADGKTVNIRVDYTNLLPYWGEMTNHARKRNAFPDPPPRPGSPGFDMWRNHTHTTSGSIRRRSTKGNTTLSTRTTANERRWFGFFTDWLKKLTKVETSDVGELPMSLQKSMLIYSARVGCPASTLSAGLDINLDARIAMNARYAYYMSGTLVPPNIIDTYAYFGLEPDAYLGVRIHGNALLQWTSDRRKLIDTLSYPGLSVKGIAAVGPTFDLWGQLDGQVRLSGQMQVGAEIKFQPAEVYWPDNADSAGYQKIRDVLPNGGVGHTDTLITPVFDASVTAAARFSVLVTPEVNMGIKVAAGLVDAQIVGFVNTTLLFRASAKASANLNGGTASYNYGIDFLYNLGYGAHVNFLKGYNWYQQPRQLFPSPRIINLYTKPDNVRHRTRSDTIDMPKAPRRGLLNPDVGNPTLSPGSPTNASIDTRELFSLEKRDLASDIASFAAGYLKCPASNGNCVSQGAGGNAGACPLRNPPKLKRSDTPMCDANVEMTDAQTCEDIVPALQYNCYYFPDESIQQNGATAQVPGICSNIQGYQQAVGSGDNPIPLTFEPSGGPTRQRATCGGYCIDRNNVLNTQFGTRTAWTSCDEFPFASTEQGGVKPNLQKVCAPTYQQTTQGNCNNLLNQLETDVSAAGDGSLYKSWSLNAWITARTDWQEVIGGGDPNIPNPPGLTGIAFPAGSTYKWRRNFVLYLMNTNNPTATFLQHDFQSASWVAVEPYFQTINKEDVMCAVSTQGSTRTRITNYNGFCWSGLLKPYGNWADKAEFKGCRVSFAGVSQGSFKRGVGQEIEGADWVDDAPSFWAAVPKGSLSRKKQRGAAANESLTSNAPRLSPLRNALYDTKV